VQLGGNNAKVDVIGAAHSNHFWFNAGQLEKVENRTLVT
jgi:hypothetical protein